MVLEVIQCTKCGSTDVSEFKTDRYVCGHCKTTFKTPRQVNDNGGGCQIDDCGVPAIGRCQQCSQRFCRTHQAIEKSYSTSYRNVPVLDWCSKCQRTHRAANAQSARERATALDTATTARALLDFLVHHGDKCDITLACDTWRRLARSGGLPNAGDELVRYRHHRVRESIWRGSIYEISEPEQLGPIWLSPKSLTLSEGLDIITTKRVDGLITSDAHVYEYINTTSSTARNALHLSDHETLVMAQRDKDLGIPRKAAVGSEIYFPIEGAAVRRQAPHSSCSMPAFIRRALEHYGV